jgi:transcriptional regulator with XRE-family HTH domain
MGKELGRYLRQLREEQGLTLRDVAREATISNAYLCMVEHGKRKPRAGYLRMLAQFYGVPVESVTSRIGDEGRRRWWGVQGPMPDGKVETIWDNEGYARARARALSERNAGKRFRVVETTRHGEVPDERYAGCPDS